MNQFNGDEKDRKRIEFYVNLIKQKLDKIKDDIGELRYNLYMKVVNQCDDYNQLREMAELDMHIEFIEYVKKAIFDKLSEDGISISDLRQFYYDTDGENEEAVSICNDALHMDDQYLMLMALAMNNNYLTIEDEYGNEEEEEDDIEIDEESLDDFEAEPDEVEDDEEESLSGDIEVEEDDIEVEDLDDIEMEDDDIEVEDSDDIEIEGDIEAEDSDDIEAEDDDIEVEGLEDYEFDGGGDDDYGDDGDIDVDDATDSSWDISDGGYDDSSGDSLCDTGIYSTDGYSDTDDTIEFDISAYEMDSGSLEEVGDIDEEEQFIESDEEVEQEGDIDVDSSELFVETDDEPEDDESEGDDIEVEGDFADDDDYFIENDEEEGDDIEVEGDLDSDDFFVETDEEDGDIDVEDDIDTDGLFIEDGDDYEDDDFEVEGGDDLEVEGDTDDIFVESDDDSEVEDEDDGDIDVSDLDDYIGGISRPAVNNISNLKVNGGNSRLNNKPSNKVFKDDKAQQILDFMHKGLGGIFVRKKK